MASPMNDEEAMLNQAILTKQANPLTRVFVYRNLVKALPWMSSVRSILDDPNYAGFFLKFKPKGPYAVPPCTTDLLNQTKCSAFYHDQEQTPEVPTPSNPNPDGACNKTCDCGMQPCGEYLFDHRNGTMLTDWLVNKYILSSTSVGNGVIDGLFIDDFWCSNQINGTGSCTDPVQGPTEVDPHNQADMGLSDEDVADITNGWLSNMRTVQEAILRAGGYTWSLIPGQSNANAQPDIISAENCAAKVRPACALSSPYIESPMLHGVTTNNIGQNVQQQVAAFLLMRGPYAWIGWGQWGMVWDPSVALPKEIWNVEYGDPIDPRCSEGPAGVFHRGYTAASVTLDCNTWSAYIEFG